MINKSLSNYHTLEDISITGRKRPWNEKKQKSLQISDSYARLGNDKKALRIRGCGTYLEFHRITSDNSLKLFHANFCKNRLCPMCNWRRSLKIFSQVSQIMDKAIAEKEYSFLFLTLTVRNMGECELSEGISSLLKGFTALLRRKRVKKAVKGSFRALEVTYNKKQDTFHPHIHAILMVDKSYLKKSDYIKQSEWTELWKDCLKLEYQPIVHIEKLGKDGNVKKAVAESAKYTIKDNDLVVDYKQKRPEGTTLEDLQMLQDKLVYVFDEALSGRRLISYSGKMKQIYKDLKLDDAVDGDLIHTDQEQLRTDVEYMVEVYGWRAGIGYVRTES